MEELSTLRDALTEPAAVAGTALTISVRTRTMAKIILFLILFPLFFLLSVNQRVLIREDYMAQQVNGVILVYGVIRVHVGVDIHGVLVREDHMTQ